MGQIGASIEEMQELQAAFSREAGTVQGLSNAISSQVSSTFWVGPAADRFRAQWESEFRPVLAQLQEALSTGSQEVSRHSAALLQAGS